MISLHWGRTTLFTNVYLGVGYFIRIPRTFCFDYWALMGSMDISEDVWLSAHAVCGISSINWLFQDQKVNYIIFLTEKCMSQLLAVNVALWLSTLSTAPALAKWKSLIPAGPSGASSQRTIVSPVRSWTSLSRTIQTTQAEKFTISGCLNSNITQNVSFRL